MRIMLEIVSRQKHSASFPISHIFGEAGGYIGRSEECEWAITDRAKKISRKHALVTFEAGSFYIEDLSSNGIRLSHKQEPVGKGSPHKIEHAEVFTIGVYSIMARLLHDPASYAGSATEEQKDLLSLVQRPPSLDPIIAMDEEEELIARRRLDEFGDLLRVRPAAPPPPSDHSDPRICTMQPVVAIHRDTAFIPDDWDSEPDEPDQSKSAEPSGQPLPPAPPEPTPQPEPAPQQEPEKVAVPETDIFFKALGLAEPPESSEERERLLVLTAELLRSAVEGMTKALQNRAECKNELRLPITTTSLAVKNNPFKFSPTPEAALATMLEPPQKGVLTAPLAMREGFKDLHSHHMGLMAGTRAVVRAALDKVSPQAVEARLDINGPIRLRRTIRLWQTYIRLHQAFQEDQDSYAGIFLHDFARAYEMQGRTLNPSNDRIAQGDKP